MALARVFPQGESGSVVLGQGPEVLCCLTVSSHHSLHQGRKSLEKHLKRAWRSSAGSDGVVCRERLRRPVLFKALCCTPFYQLWNVIMLGAPVFSFSKHFWAFKTAHSPGRSMSVIRLQRQEDSQECMRNVRSMVGAEFAVFSASPLSVLLPPFLSCFQVSQMSGQTEHRGSNCAFWGYLMGKLSS